MCYQCQTPKPGQTCTQPVLGGSGPICIPTSSHLGQSGGETKTASCRRIILIAPAWLNMPWFWDLMAMSSEILLSLPYLYNLLTQPFNQTPHWNLSNFNLHEWLLEPQQSRSRTSLKQWQHELRLRRGDQPDQSYEAKWTIFTKWYLSNQVDFRAPPIKSVADLFQDRKLQPSTIDGYRSAIAGKLGNSPINVTKDENLTRLLDSFHRDTPKERRGISSGKGFL